LQNQGLHQAAFFLERVRARACRTTTLMGNLFSPDCTSTLPPTLWLDHILPRLDRCSVLRLAHTNRYLRNVALEHLDRVGWPTHCERDRAATKSLRLALAYIDTCTARELGQRTDFLQMLGQRPELTQDDVLDRLSVSWLRWTIPDALHYTAERYDRLDWRLVLEDVVHAPRAGTTAACYGNVSAMIVALDAIHNKVSDAANPSLTAHHLSTGLWNAIRRGKLPTLPDVRKACVRVGDPGGTHLDLMESELVLHPTLPMLRLLEEHQGHAILPETARNILAVILLFGPGLSCDADDLDVDHTAVTRLLLARGFWASPKRCLDLVGIRRAIFCGDWVNFARVWDASWPHWSTEQRQDMESVVRAPTLKYWNYSAALIKWLWRTDNSINALSTIAERHLMVATLGRGHVPTDVPSLPALVQWLLWGSSRQRKKALAHCQDQLVRPAFKNRPRSQREALREIVAAIGVRPTGPEKEAWRRQQDSHPLTWLDR